MKRLALVAPALFLVSFALIVSGKDALGWVLVQLALLSAVLSPSLGWLIRAHLLPGIASCVIKVGFVGFAAFPWWSMRMPPVTDKSSVFLFGTIPFCVVLQWLEIAIVEKYLPEVAEEIEEPSK